MSKKLTFVFTFVKVDKKTPWGEVIGTFTTGKKMKEAIKDWLVKNDASEGEIIKAIHELMKTKGHTPFYGHTTLSVQKTPLDEYPLVSDPDARKTKSPSGKVIKSPLSSKSFRSILAAEKKVKAKVSPKKTVKKTPKLLPKKKGVKKTSKTSPKKTVPKKSPVKKTGECGCILATGNKLLEKRGCTRPVKEGTNRCWQHQGRK
jgi:hypothetical protein